ALRHLGVDLLATATPAIVVLLAQLLFLFLGLGLAARLLVLLVPLRTVLLGDLDDRGEVAGQELAERLLPLAGTDQESERVRELAVESPGGRRVLRRLLPEGLLV